MNDQSKDILARSATQSGCPNHIWQIKSKLTYVTKQQTLTSAMGSIYSGQRWPSTLIFPTYHHFSNSTVKIIIET